LLLLLFYFIHLIFSVFCYFAWLSTSNTCQPQKKQIEGEKTQLKMRFEPEKWKKVRATNQFYDKASPPFDFIPKFRNLNIKYLQL